MTNRGPKPTVTNPHTGTTYTLRGYNTEVPDLAAMSSIGASVWINQNTQKRGYQTYARVNIQGLTMDVR